MKIEKRRYAPWGLGLTLVALLAAFGLYVVQGEFNLPVQLSLGLAVVGLAVFVFLDPDRARRALTGRQARYSSNALVMTLAVLGILVVTNYLVFENPQRWDLTEDQTNTLAPETVDTLKAIPEPVTALAFFTDRTQPDQAQRLLDDYKYNGGDRFNYRFINPESDPVAARQANITRDGTVVLQMGAHQEQVTFVTERELTAALIRLMSPDEKVVYFLTGHGERDPEGVDDAALSSARALLETKNYSIQKLNLLATNTIPEDARLIIIAGPIQPVSQGEVDLLDDFLQSGGAMIVMQEPPPVTEFGSSPDPLGAYLNQNLAISLGEDIIVDLTSNQPFVAVANQYGNHPITQKLRGLVTFFPTARSLQIGTVPSSWTETNLVMTADQSWAERDLTSLQNQQGISPDEGVDLLGPVTIAVTAENSDNDARVVVFGDSDFATDAYFNSYGNSDLWVNAVDWATQQEDLINLTPKETTSRVLLAPRRTTLSLILLGSVFFLPGLVVFSGAVIWIRRRGRG